MGALAAPEERQDAYAPLLMAAATELWGPTGGWQPGPPAPPPTPPPVVEFAFAPLPPVEFAPLPPVEFAPLPPVEFAPSTPVAFAAEVVAPALVAPRIPAQDATLAQGTTVAVVLRILVQDTDTTVAVAPHMSAPVLYQFTQWEIHLLERDGKHGRTQKTIQYLSA